MSHNKEVFVAKISHFHIFATFLILLSAITTITRAATTATVKPAAATITPASTITTITRAATTATVKTAAAATTTPASTVTTITRAATTATVKTAAATTTPASTVMTITRAATTTTVSTATAATTTPASSSSTPFLTPPFVATTMLMTSTTGTTSTTASFGTTIPTSISANTLEPSYGPMAGGTAITIVTTWTSPNILITAVYIGSYYLNADILSQSTSNNYTASKITVVVRSPPMVDVSQIDKPLPITLRIYPDLFNVYTGMYFTYKQNPTINDTNPRVIPLSGGLRLNVTGSNLASASNPRIRAVVIVWRNNSLSSRNESFGPCYQPNENGTQMTCLSPPIYIPQDFLLYLFGETDVYRRRKRRDVLASDWLKGHGTLLTSGSRFKRSLNNILTNHTYELPGTGDKVEISVDVSYDWFVATLDSGKQFQVRPNPPNISCADNIYFDSKESATISIKGNDKDHCCGKSDYTVRIGNGFCTVTGLTDNELTCEPPKDKPQQTENDTLYCGENFAVFIDVGDKNYRCSCLTYVDSSKTTLIIIIAATVGSALVIFIAIIVIAICVRRSRTRRRPRTPEESIRNPLGDRRGVMMTSRQPNDIASLKSNETNNTDLAPEGHFNRLPRPGYTPRPANQPGGYHYQNQGNLGYDRTFEDDLDQPLQQQYFPYSRNI